MDDDDIEQTRVTCPKCGGDAQECTLCKGEGSVTAAVASAWRFEKAGRIAGGSGEHAIQLPKKP